MAGKVNVPITVALQGLANTQRNLHNLSKGIANVGKTAGLAAIGFATFTAGIKAADFAMQAIAGARDLERNLEGLRTVFDEATPQMEQFSKNAYNMGLSMNEAAKASTFIGSVLKQSGFAIDETADLTERLIGLATDLSLTYGYDVQEALLGMTALFRGEYDPIEKFGVAMKQSEIDAEKAARGLSGLTGAAERYADQQIRVQFLFERAQDAMGAFSRQTGNLATEQLKLGAEFRNVRDTVAESLLPAIATLLSSTREVLEDVKPELVDAFERMAPIVEQLSTTIVPALADALLFVIDVVKETASLFDDLLDPTTEVGESVTAVSIAIGDLFELITGEQLTIEAVFEGIAGVIGFVADAVHDVIYVIENFIIGLQTVGELINMLLWADIRAFTTDWGALIRQRIADKDAAREQEIATRQLNQAIRDQEIAVASLKRAQESAYQQSFEYLSAIIPNFGGKSSPRITGDDATDTENNAKTEAKDYVKSFFEGLSDEMAKQRARLQLEQMTASEGLIDLILGSQGWMDIWLQIKQGTLSLKDLEEQFYKTAAGAKELEDAAKAAAEAQEEYDRAVADINAKLEEDLRAIAVRAKEVKESFKELIDGFSILPTIQREIGQFEGQVTDYLSSIEQSLKDTFDAGDLLQQGYNDLRAYARQELSILAEIGRQRDEIARRYDFAKALIDNYRQAFTASLSLTSLFSRLQGGTQEVLVTETSEGLRRVGDELREFQFTVSRSYTQTFEEVQDKTAGLLDGFRTMAEKARSFAENLRRLKELGLDPQLFDQLVQAGVEAGGETAQALVDGGSETITEINSLFAEIDALGADLGEEVGATMYGSGINMADGLLEGLRSKQNELEATAIAMAEAFSRNFQANVNIQVDAAASQAADSVKQAASDAIAAIPVPEQIVPSVDQAALSKINTLISNASSYIQNIGDATKAAGALVKRDIYQSLKADIEAGRTVDLSGITSGLSSAELAQRAVAAGGTTINNYITVEANTRTGGAKAGEEIATALQQLSNTSSNYSVSIGG